MEKSLEGVGLLLGGQRTLPLSNQALRCSFEKEISLDLGISEWVFRGLCQRHKYNVALLLMLLSQR